MSDVVDCVNSGRILVRQWTRTVHPSITDTAPGKPAFSNMVHNEVHRGDDHVLHTITMTVRCSAYSQYSNLPH